MAVRPSVVIGLGTTGSSVTTAIYNRFKEFCEQTGEHLESIQFINIDTAEAVAGADDLKMKGRYISIALPQAEAALQASLEFDRFMKQWWPKSYTQIGNLVDGAGTVPIHGRFAFWQGIGPGGAAEDQFLPLFNRSMVEVSKYAPDKVGQPDVYIFSTLCGGTGAGCFLDVAHMIREDPDYGDCKIYGFIVMPDIVNMKALPDVHAKTQSNAYGCLIELNHWLIEPGLRPLKDELTPFMKKGNETIDGDSTPFHAVFMISRFNSNMRAFSDWQDYMDMLANAGAFMMFSPAAKDVADGLNNYVTLIRSETKSTNPQPRRFGSLGAYTLRYSPERAESYLRHVMEESALGEVLRQSGIAGKKAAEQMHTFMERNELREMDEYGKGGAVNEVIDYLADVDNPALTQKPYKRLQGVLDNLQISGPETALVKGLEQRVKKKSDAKQIVGRTSGQAEKAFLGVLTGPQGGHSPGVNYKSLLEELVNLKYDRVMDALIVTCRRILEVDNGGVPATNLFLTILAARLVDHKASLESELAGVSTRLMVGNEEELQTYKVQLPEKMDELGTRLSSNKLLKALGGGGNPAQDFQNQWWNPYFQKLKRVLEKKAGCELYDRIIRSVTDLHRFSHDTVQPKIEHCQTEALRAMDAVYGRDAFTDQAIVNREEYAIHDGSVLKVNFKTELNAAVARRREQIRTRLGDTLEDYKNLVAKGEATTQNGQELADELMRDSDSDSHELGEEVFQNRVQTLSLWDALALDSGQTKKVSIQAEVQKHVNNVLRMCAPMWQINKEFNALADESHKVLVESYDQDVLQDFEEKHHFEIKIGPAATGAAAGGNRVNQSSYRPSPHEYKVLRIEGGVPLQFHQSVTEIEESYKYYRENHTQPSVRDKRIDILVDRVGIPTWIAVHPETTIAEIVLVKLLLLEHFGVLTGPFVRHGQTSGSYKLWEHNLGNQREKAFIKAIKLITDNNNEEDKLEGELEVLLSNYTRDDWKHQHVCCYKRLEDVLSRTGAQDIKEQLTTQRNSLQHHITTKFNIDVAQLISLTHEVTC